MKFTRYLILGATICIIVGFGVFVAVKRNQSLTLDRPYKCLQLFPSEDCRKIPADWSGYLSGEYDYIDPTDSLAISPPDVSFAPGIVSFGDTNWEQVDIYYSEASLSDWKQALERKASEWEGTFQKAELKNTSGWYVQWPLDNGQVTKAGTGGQTYVFPNRRGDVTVINKQALGSEDFEKGFQFFLDHFSDPKY